jgi:two-component system response regulator WspF
MKVGIVNDSRAAAEVLRRILAEVSGFDHLWTAHSGEEALQLCAGSLPDIILMDLIMPGIDGAETTRRIMQTMPCVILVVTATTVGNRDQVFEAMGNGALDAVNTPTLGRSGDMAGAETLIQKLRMVARLVSPAGPAAPVTAALPVPVPFLSATMTFSAPNLPVRRPDTTALQIVAIGTSTGGPQALAEVLSHLPPGFPAAVLIAQHVDEQFAPGLATWLQHYTQLPVRIASHGEPLIAATIYLAGSPANDHLICENGHLQYTPNPRATPYRPSVDALFNSLAEPHRVLRLGVLLTGMGRDGGEGLLNMRSFGALTIAQDAASSVVYGMPKAAAELKAAAEVLPLTAIGPRIRDAILHTTQNSGLSPAAKIPRS